MGADLYIDNLPRENQIRGFEVSKDAVEAGYFRDCYNGGGLFAVINASSGHSDLSWWQTVKRKDLFDAETGKMTVEGTKKWLAELKPIIAEFKALPVLYLHDYDMVKHCSIRGDKVKHKKEYYDWVDLFVGFLEKAIELKSTITFSV
jgi:hypothetical protein